MNLLLALLLATGIGKSAINQSFSEGIGSRYYNANTVDREILPGFTYYLQGGDTASYPGTGRIMTSVLPSPPGLPSQYNPTAVWYRYDSTGAAEQPFAPPFSNGWFSMQSGGAAPFFWLRFAAEDIPPPLNYNNTKFNANGDMTLFWRGNLSSAGTNVIVAITTEGNGGGQFYWRVNASDIAVDQGYFSTLGSVSYTVPRGQDVVLAVRRSGGATGTWSLFVNGDLKGSFTSGTALSGTGVNGTTGMGVGILRPPIVVPPVDFFSGKFQSFVSYDSALSNSDIAFNSEKLALWGASP